MITWIKGGTLIDPVKETNEKRDLIIEGERITKIIPPGIYSPDDKKICTIDASGRIVVPGLIDMHVHLREPGYEYKETILTGATAGAAGGFTGLACMPNTSPSNDCRSVTEFIIKEGDKNNLSKIYPVAAITVGQLGERLTEFGDLKEAGAVAVSDDGLPVINSEIMRRALEYASYHGLTVISHCEDLSLSENGVMHEGMVSTQIGLPGIPSESEEIMISRDIALAKLTGCPVHIAHVSSAGSVELIKRAKESGVPVTAETAPHYFSLNHNAVRGYDTNTKMKPPLRTEDDVEAVKMGLADGVIDVIATDHAPHSALDKQVEFDKAAFGIIGLETAVPLVLGLVRQGVLTISQAVRKMSYNPASILRIPCGSLQEKSRADLSIIDTEYEYELIEEDIFSKSKNTPFLGKTLRGRNNLTMIGGKVVWERDL